ncbi:MAG TPA: hypothetical protein DCW68_06260 [Rhodospirillaceae bacterium]|nr:MAG: hypothetical protein A2018_03960 [Alphaproteobacteria bacterium GWF2_58_20]HAU29693.1 hypothetical protein [Rhodospirillaceae bacterium]
MMRKQAFNFRDHFRLHDPRHVADGSLRDICQTSGLTPEKLCQAITDTGLAYLRQRQDISSSKVPSDRRSGWLYVYDPETLQAFLDKNHETLVESEWPTQAADFVIHLAYVIAPACTPIFDLIHEAYGNDSQNGTNPWLQCNQHKLSSHTIEAQRQRAEQSRHRYINTNHQKNRSMFSMHKNIALAALFAMAASTSAPAAILPETKKVTPISRMGHEKGTMGIAPDNYKAAVFEMLCSLQTKAQNDWEIVVVGNIQKVRNISFPKVAIDMLREIGLTTIKAMNAMETIELSEKVQKHIEEEFRKQEKAKAVFSIPAHKGPKAP